MTKDPANPLGLNGFEFVEFTSPEPEKMAAQFEQLGFTATHRHPTKNITRYKQGRINLMLNRDDAGRVAAFRGEHGPSASAMAFRVADPEAALRWALDHGGKPTDENDTVIQGIGGSYLYFMPDGGDPYADWAEYPGWREAEARNNVGLDLLDHLTHNVKRGQMRVWSEFYRTLFGFEEQKYFDIKGKATGLFSQAMIAPDRAIRSFQPIACFLTQPLLLLDAVLGCAQLGCPFSIHLLLVAELHRSLLHISGVW